jgi:Derlin-2/3
LGIFSGHLYWFFEDVYPQIRPGRRLLSTPKLLKLLFDAPPVETPEARGDAEEEEQEEEEGQGKEEEEEDEEE